MMLPIKHTNLARITILLLVCLLLLLGCGQSPQPDAPSSTDTQQLQATVAALQTQIASQPKTTTITQTPQPRSLPSPTVALNTVPTLSSPATSVATATRVAESPTITTAANVSQGYLADHRPDGTPGVFFIQWSEENGEISGDIRGTLFVRIKGIRNGSGLNLSLIYADGTWEVYSGTIQANKLILHSIKDQKIEWMFQATSVVDYSNKLITFIKSLPSVPDAYKAVPVLSDKAKVQGYIANKYADVKEPVVVYFQFAEENGHIVGDMRFIEFSRMVPSKITSWSPPMIGTRSGSNMDFPTDNGQSWSAKIQGDTIVFTNPSLILKVASETEYNRAVKSYTASESPFSLFIQKKAVSDAGNGWQKAVTTLGIRNFGPTAYPIYFKDGNRAHIEINGTIQGYDASLYLSTDQKRDGFDISNRFNSNAQIHSDFGAVHGLPVPPGFALCGIAFYDEALKGIGVIQAEGRIPQNTEVDHIDVSGYGNLLNTQTPESCRPYSLDHLPPASAGIAWPSQRNPTALIQVKSINPSVNSKGDTNLKMTTVKVEIENTNKLGDLTLRWLFAAGYDDDGIVRPLVGTAADSDCSYPIATDTVIGPSQKKELNFCFVSRPNPMVAFAIWSIESNTSVVVRLDDRVASSATTSSDATPTAQVKTPIDQPNPESNIESELQDFFNAFYKARSLSRSKNFDINSYKSLVGGAFINYTIPLLEQDMADVQNGKLIEVRYSDIHVHVEEVRPGENKARVSVIRSMTEVRSDRGETKQTATYQFWVERRSGDESSTWIVFDFFNPTTNHWVSEEKH